MVKVMKGTTTLLPMEAIMADVDKTGTQQNQQSQRTEQQGQSRRASGVDLETRRELRHETRRNQTFKAFLKNLAAIGSMNEEEAERAAVSVLCVLEQRLFGEEASHLEAQLPGKLQDLLMRCERHVGKPASKFGKDGFILMVSEDLGIDANEAERKIRAVFTAVRDQVTEGEIEDVIGQLPADLRELWQRAI
jgi:uncharacterized protein (DUF2267 family)